MMMMFDTATQPPGQDRDAVRHLLSAVLQAVDVPAPGRACDAWHYLRLMERRVVAARTSIARLVADPDSNADDYMSEGDHILHCIADLPSPTYRQSPPKR